MTTPMDPNAPASVGLLGRIFGKVQRAPQPPAGIEDRLSYTDQPGSQGTDAAYYLEGRVPNIDNGYFPTIANQDSILIHYDRPPADKNPQEWYDDRNIWAKQQRESIEHQVGVPWMDDTSKTGPMADDPKWTPPTVNRPTAFLSPSSYRFTRPYGQDVEHELNGVHLSLADNRRAYNLSGNVGRTQGWNNSYRIDPVSNDAQVVFVGDSVANDVGTQIIYANSTNTTSKRSYRL